MESVTVAGLVDALVDTYASLLHHHTIWKRARIQRNTYRRHTAQNQSSQGTGGPTCALSTSLRVSGPMIKETYDNAAAIAGDEISAGDSGTKEKLQSQLQLLQERLEDLQHVVARGNGPLELAELLKASESGRVFCMKALAAQYQRIAIGRPIPKELPMPKPRSRQEGLMRSESRQGSLVGSEYDDDRMTTAMTINSGPLGFQSDPPSPPPTPKPDDTESTSQWVGSETGGPAAMLRPNNSVFSVFCPEAMSLQVNLNSPTPDEKRCKCGYRWKPSLPDKKDAVLLKEGFRMTVRFLAKSHCDKRAYGCVLCTSSGKTDVYESAEHLGVHINASHTKWQMLHDRDMA